MKPVVKTLCALALAAALCSCSPGGANESSSVLEESIPSSSESTLPGYVYGENEMYQDIWNSKTIYNETVVPVEQDDGTFSSQLLYTPTRILSVRNFTLEREYSPDEYRIEGNRLILTENSTMPRLTKANVSCEEVPETLGTYEDGKGGHILFTEGIGIIMQQVNVTYEHEGTWDGTIPEKQGAKLPKLQAKLKAKDPIRLVVNGDSIFTGANASGKLGIEPFQDTFPDGFANEIKRVYGSSVTLTNTAVGGQVSSWGRQNVENNINLFNPDLVIIGFGMNDGSWNVSSFDYVDNIDFMIRSIKANCPDAEIIVASTIVANPSSSQNKGQASYLEPLKDMVNEYKGVALLDMTTFSLDLLRHKSSFELYANNINHPCDFLVRGYVSNLMNLIKE